MKRYIFITVTLSAILLALFSCNKLDDRGDVDGTVDAITLKMDGLELSTEVATKATVGGKAYVVNTSSDPTRTRDHNSVIIGRDSWKLDIELFTKATMALADMYVHGSFDGGLYNADPAVKAWEIPANKVYPNYFRPWGKLWLYPGDVSAADRRDPVILTDQSAAADFLAQDILYLEGRFPAVAHEIEITNVKHDRAMINFRIDDIVKSHINLATVRVHIDGDTYIPYDVSDASKVYFEFMLIVPGRTGGTKIEDISITYETNSTAFQQASKYIFEVKQPLGSTKTHILSNQCLCFSISGKLMEIAPVTVVEWSTGEPVSGEYVAVTAYPTLKGLANTTFFLYFDNALKEYVRDPVTNEITEVLPKLQEVWFNHKEEATIKPDGRVITHIFPEGKETAVDASYDMDASPYKLATPITLGGTDGKMYIDIATTLTAILAITP